MKMLPVAGSITPRARPDRGLRLRQLCWIKEFMTIAAAEFQIDWMAPVAASRIETCPWYGAHRRCSRP